MKKNKSNTPVLITEVPVSNKDIITDAELQKGEIIPEKPEVFQEILDETISNPYDVMLVEENKLKIIEQESVTPTKFSTAERKALRGNFSKRTLLGRYGIRL